MDAKAMAIILNSLERPVVRSVMSLTTAHDMWTRLSTLYESRCKVSMSLLLHEFHAYRMTEEMEMATHIANVESLAHRLGDLGKVIDESEIMAKLLNLPRRYRHLLFAWNNMDPKLQTRDGLIPRLLKEEKLEMKDEVQETESDSVAIMARTKQSKGESAQPQKFTGKCYHCDKVGHRKKGSFKWRKEKKSQGQDKAYASKIVQAK